MPLSLFYKATADKRRLFSIDDKCMMIFTRLLSASICVHPRLPSIGKGLTAQRVIAER